jgi:hypothetical protein
MGSAQRRKPRRGRRRHAADDRNMRSSSAHPAEQLSGGRVPDGHHLDDMPAGPGAVRIGPDGKLLSSGRTGGAEADMQPSGRLPAGRTPHRSGRTVSKKCTSVDDIVAIGEPPCFAETLMKSDVFRSFVRSIAAASARADKRAQQEGSPCGRAPRNFFRARFSRLDS